MSLVNKNLLVNKIKFYIRDENRQRIIRDNPILGNMLNDVLAICENEELVYPEKLTTEDLQLIDECLYACIKVCESVKANTKAKNITKVLDKVASLEVDCEDY